MFCAKCGKELPEGATFCPSCGTPVQAAGTGASAATSTTGFDSLAKDQKAQQYWVERFFAYVIDAIIVYVVLGILTLFIAIPALLTGGLNLFSLVFGGVTTVWGLIFVFYFAVMESSSGASIGKKVFSLRVVSKTGSNPNFAEAIVRNISKINPLLLLLDVIIGLAVSKGYTQKFSDHFMGTAVTKR